MKLPENKLFCIICWGIAVFCFFKVNPNAAPRAFKLEDASIVAVAEVIRYKKNSNGTNIPTIRYRAFDTDHTVTTDFFNNHDNRLPKRGEKFEIEVNLKNPKKIRHSSDRGLKMPLDLLLSLLLLFGLPYVPDKYLGGGGLFFD